MTSKDLNKKCESSLVQAEMPNISKNNHRSGQIPQGDHRLKQQNA